MKQKYNEKFPGRFLNVLLAFSVAAASLYVPGEMMSVKADDVEFIQNVSNASYLSKSDLNAGGFNSNYGLSGGKKQKVYFGSRTDNNTPSSQSWYIAGKNEDGTLVLMCDPEKPMKTSQVFNSSNADKTINDSQTDIGIYDNRSEITQVYANHYGASDLRKYLTGEALNNFSDSEKKLMAESSIYTKDTNNNVNYQLKDKLYAACDNDGTHSGNIIVGNTNNSTPLKIQTGIDLFKQSSVNSFWLRAPNSNYSDLALLANPGGNVNLSSVYDSFAVLPAFHLNLSSVLFASAAPAASSGSTMNDGMTFRYDAGCRIESCVTNYSDHLDIEKNDAGTLYLYVQYSKQINGATTDFIYSTPITASKSIQKSEINNEDGFELDYCKIWLEVEDDNLSYAKTVDTSTEHHPSYTDNGSNHFRECSTCGYKVTENHIDADNNGKCDKCDKQLSVVINEVSATLQGDIGMNYYVTLPDSVTSDTGAYAEFEVNGEKKKVPVRNDNLQGDGRYKFTVWLTAKEMRDTVSFRICDGNDTALELYTVSRGKLENPVFDYSLNQYFEAISSDENSTARLKELADATLVYGAAAQKVFNHNADSVTVDNTKLSAVNSETLDSYKAVKTGTLPVGLALDEMTLILREKTSARLYFTSAVISDYNFELDSNSVLPAVFDSENNKYYIEIPNIAAKDLDTAHTLKIQKSGETEKYTITYSALSYVYSVLESTKSAADLSDNETNLVNVVKALYNYNKAADGYFAG